MKSRKFEKKLAVNKRTISSLQTNEMGKVKGGNVTDNTLCTNWNCNSYISCYICIDPD